MADREKVIKALEHHRETAVCIGCPYAEDIDTAQGYCPIYDDALALLREQETTTYALPREQETTTYAYDEYVTPMCQKCGFHPFAGYIPTLKWMEQKGYYYCSGCGRRIKWEVRGDADGA